MAVSTDCIWLWFLAGNDTLFRPRFRCWFKSIVCVSTAKEWCQLFAVFEQKNTCVRGWGQGYCDQLKPLMTTVFEEPELVWRVVACPGENKERTFNMDATLKQQWAENQRCLDANIGIQTSLVHLGSHLPSRDRGVPAIIT